MMIQGTLKAHLEEIDREATAMVEHLTREMAKRENVTEELKAQDQMKWVGLMNNFRAAAEEVVLKDLIYN